VKPALILGAVAAILFGLHRLALFAESRGWIHYTKAGRSSGSLGNAFLEIQSIVEPSKRYIVEERRAAQPEKDDSGEPPAEDEGGSGGRPSASPPGSDPRGHHRDA